MIERPVLITMRLADMIRVHPRQIERTCARCGHAVGIYPSGQVAMRLHPEIEIICHVCRPRDEEIITLAPGAGLVEALESVPGPAAEQP